MIKTRKEKNKDMNKGITLIALVITIIVLLILAAVSIATLTGENGILTRAQDARTNTEVAEEKEAIGLAYNGVMAENRGDGVNAGELEAELIGNGYDVTASGSNPITVKFNDSQRVYTIDSSGKISEQPGTGGGTGNPAAGTEVTKPENWTSDKVTAIADGEGNTIPLPDGFYYVGGTKDTGVVISDSPADKNKGTSHETAQTLSGNQFVWVPVENDAEFIRYDGYYDGSYDEGFIDDCAEPDTTNGYATEKEEFDAMNDSVLRYDGFYVARYEASEESGKAASKQGKSVWNYIAWGDSMSSIGTNGAVYKAQQMYTDKNTYGVTSTLIYGVQWDAIMAWIDPAYKTGSCESTSFVRDSSGKGYYNADTPTTTGSSSNYAVKNIYDLAGNVAEWTMESYDTTLRVIRGRSLRLLWVRVSSFLS